MPERKFITQEIGSFRKPDYLSRRFHQIQGTEEFTKLAEKATLETLGLFDQAGLMNVGVGGEMFRWEMYEHLANSLEGIEFYGLVRSFDNKYYKKGSVVSNIKRKSSFHGEELEFIINNTEKRIKVPITGPYTMMDWSFNEAYKSREDLAMAYADIINQEIKDLKKIWGGGHGEEKLEIQIDEPAATTHPSEMDLVVDSVNRSIEGIQDTEFSIHVCYSRDYRLLYDRIPDLKLHGLNLEYANRDTMMVGVSDEARIGYDDIAYFSEINEEQYPRKFLGLGVTDVHINEIESVQLIRDRIEYAMAFIENPTNVRINPDCGLRTRSREIGYQKLKNMVEARDQVYGEY
jgi:5-methyltetrahydropteroyltriglutamate--homocysteine methyltransferase